MTDSKTATELLPCPFCGGEAHTYKNNLWHVACENANNSCVTMSAFITEAEAIAAWNTRAERTCHAESDLSEWVCSNCQCWIPLGLTPENIAHASEWRYCPHCGARVTGGES